MVRVYIARPDRYLNRVKPDSDLRELYGDYDDGELRGLIGTTIRGFNSLKELSIRERPLRKDSDNKPDVLRELLEIVKFGFRAVTGNYARIALVCGKPEMVDMVAFPAADSRVELPRNGYPFLDHDNDYVAGFLQGQRKLKGTPLCFDTEGDFLGERVVICPPEFNLNGTGEEITRLIGREGSVSPEHVTAAYASLNGLSSIVLSKDGSVIGFLGGHMIRDLSYKPSD